VTQSDLETLTRAYLDEPDVNGRFSSATLTLFLNRAQDALALALYWPEGRVTGTWNTNQENPLVEDMLAVLRVYVAGQEAVPTSIPVLEGQQLEMYDQSGTGQKPEWIALDRAPYANPSSYPVTATQGVTGYPVPQVPGYPIRPAYYVRGANLGLIPQPTSGTLVTIDFVVRPAQLSSSSPNGLCVFPEICRDALCAKACELAMASEKQYEAANYWAARFERALFDPRAGLLKWKKEFTKQFVERPVPVTYRTFYRTPMLGPAAW
jgi:hypothetical protein